MTKTFLTNYNESELKLMITDCITETLNNNLPERPASEISKKKILTRQQTAEILQVSLPSLNNYTKEGLIKAFRLGHKVRYKYDDVFDALKQIKVGGKLCS